MIVEVCHDCYFENVTLSIMLFSSYKRNSIDHGDNFVALRIGIGLGSEKSDGVNGQFKFEAIPRQHKYISWGP